jgi:hypothetical protein
MQVKTTIIIPADWTIVGESNLPVKVTGWINRESASFSPLIRSMEWPGVSMFMIKPDCMIRVIELVEQILIDNFVNAKISFIDQFGCHD